jgi:membrane-bound lytic murein transglycosylase A
MRPAYAPRLCDDQSRDSLILALNSQINFLARTAAWPDLKFGPRRVSRAAYARALGDLVQLAQNEPDPAKFSEGLKQRFDFFEVYGDRRWGDAFVTSYFEPEIQGALKPTERFSQPLYRTPPDLLSLDLEKFDAKYKGERKLRARVSDNQVVPYFSRRDIDRDFKLKGQKLEICWVDPIDAFFLQVQGSGTVVLPDGQKLYLNYAEKNGLNYEALGRIIKAKYPALPSNLNSIEAFLRSLPLEERNVYLDQNPSYVFFRLADVRATTASGEPAQPGRTIATDPRFFPKGALAFLSFEAPEFGTADAPQPDRFVPAGRLVVDQDTGGAIKGPGRVDLFWGRGPEAKRFAGAVQGWGRLYYLVPKESKR